MILQALQKLCESEKLNENPDYEFRRISWQIDISPTGKLLGVHSFRIDLNANNERKAKYVGRWSSVPKQPIRTAAAKSFFLVDKAEYILGLDPTGKRSAADRKERQGLFQEQVQALLDETKSKFANSILKFLADLKSHQKTIKELPAFAEMEPNDLLGFAVKGKWVHLEDSVQKHWAETRSIEAEEATESDAANFQCLISGEPFKQIQNFPQIKHVPGGKPAAIAIVSHNKSAFCSYGLDGSENAPVSRAAAVAGRHFSQP